MFFFHAAYAAREPRALFELPNEAKRGFRSYNFLFFLRRADPSNVSEPTCPGWLFYLYFVLLARLGGGSRGVK